MSYWYIQIIICNVSHSSIATHADWHKQNMINCNAAKLYVFMLWVLDIHNINSILIRVLIVYYISQSGLEYQKILANEDKQIVH
jgi:hypothetical protein